LADQDQESRSSRIQSSVILEIDKNRCHLAILESYQLLQDLKCSQSLFPTQRQLVTRALLRLHFFLIHSDSPILTPSDRQALARVQQVDLANALDHGLERIRDLARDRHL
jgi:hypothetical protein